MIKLAANNRMKVVFMYPSILHVVMFVIALNFACRATCMSFILDETGVIWKGYYSCRAYSKTSLS